MLLLTLRGTPTVYYGDEIAMKEVAIAPAHVRDPLGKNVPGRGLGRDGCRTPMQWDSTTHAGFSSVEPWLPLGGALDQDNVLAQRSDNTSVYRLYRRLIDLRRKRPALSLGRYGSVRADGNLLVFTREHEREQLFVALNFASAPVAASLPSSEGLGGCSYHPPEIVRTSRCAAASICGRTKARLWSFAMARGSVDTVHSPCTALPGLAACTSAPQCRDCGSGQLTGRIHYSRLETNSQKPACRRGAGHTFRKGELSGQGEKVRRSRHLHGCWSAGCSARRTLPRARGAIPGFISAKPTPLSRSAQTGLGLAPLRARAAHIVQLGAIGAPLIGQHRPPIIRQLGAQFQSRGGET